MTARTIKTVKISDTTTVYVYKTRIAEYSVFARVETDDDGYVCFCKEFQNVIAAVNYADRVVAKLSK